MANCLVIRDCLKASVYYYEISHRNLSTLAVVWAYYMEYLPKFLVLQFHQCHPKYTLVNSIALYAPLFFFIFESLKVLSTEAYLHKKEQF
jgi:hypothetical protein